MDANASRASLDDLEHEHAPLLSDIPQHRGRKRQSITPLPKAQIGVLLWLQLAEPITRHTLFPFVYQLVSELEITKGRPEKVGYYVGVIESVFFVSESVTILQWSRLSDYIGRKPVLLTGVGGLCLSTLAFGLSKTFWALVVSRSIAGLLCGNAGVRKSTLGELTDATSIGQGAALMPITWSIGATIGPFIGGMLSRPHDHFPETFKARFWEEYPYFLPCATSAFFCLIAFAVAFFYLQETVKELKQEPIIHAQSNFDHAEQAGRSTDCDEDRPQLDRPHAPPEGSNPLPLRKILTYPVLLSVLCYATLGVLGSSIDALQVVLYASPVVLGGLGLSSSTIGLLLSAFGLIDGVLQALFFAPVVRRVGPRRLFRICIGSAIGVYGMFALMHALASAWGVTPVVWLALMVQLIFQAAVDTGYSCMFIFITTSAPNRRTLGATNGIAQTLIGVARALGPALSTSLFAYSNEHHVLGGYLVYLVLGCVVLCALYIASHLPENGWDVEARRENRIVAGGEQSFT